MRTLKIYALMLLAFGTLLSERIIGVESQAIEPLVLVHGGAGSIADHKVAGALEGVRLAARTGYNALRSSGNVLSAVEEAVRSLERDERFNCGYGGVLTWDGDVELDAAIMDGATLNGGCVSLVHDIVHPITLARRVMETTAHTYMAGEGAMNVARANGIEILPAGSLVTPDAVAALEAYKNSLNGSNSNSVSDFIVPGTVGAVAIDAFGNVAAATSTGGLTGKMCGRIGDSPILGAGTYADNETGATSCTGHGESFIRYNVAGRIHAYIRLQGMSAANATITVLDEMTEHFNQQGGVISVDRQGNVGIHFTSSRMSWAYQRGSELHYGINKGDDCVDEVPMRDFDFY